jgi:tetratricopeptide (TPR) repeat protein
LLGFSAALAGRVVAKVRRQLAFLGLGLVLVGTAAANLVARYHATNIFFIGWLVNSESARSVIIEGTGPQLGHRPIYLIDYSINPLLFEQYAPGVKVTVLPLPSTALDRLTANEIRDGLFYTVSKGLWHQVPITLPEGETPPELADTATAADIALIPELRELLPNAPGSWYNTYKVGLNFMSRNPRKAEYYLRQAIALVGPGNPYPYFHLGQLFHQQGNFAEAIKYYEMAVLYDTAPSRFKEAVAAAQQDMDEARLKHP